MKSGEYLRDLRKKRNLTLLQVSEKSGISHTQIADIEKGFNHGTPNTLELILTAMSMTDDERDIFLCKQDYEKAPLSVKKELEELRDRIKYLENNSINNITNHVSDVTGDNSIMETNIMVKKLEDIDISDLSEEKLDELKKYIKYLKSND